MTKRTILFDLDGTLTDSGEGILACTEAMLRHYGLPIPDRKEMRFMIGPPLKESFPRFGVKPEDLTEAIEIYRQHYETSGVYQNFPYPGIRQLLQQLRAEGHTLCVATSKPEYMANIVLQHFDLARYFDHICGASATEERSTKDEVIAYLLQKIGNPDNMIMVGDTIYDVLGAAAFGIPTIGVAWGYGIPGEMRAAGAIAIARNAEELLKLLDTAQN